MERFNAEVPQYAKKPLAGAYIIKHISGVYVGSTKDLYQRKANHESMLKKGKHSNKALQAAYSEYPFIQFSCFITNTEEEAKRVEQEILDRHIGGCVLFNVAPNAEKAALGVKRSEESRKKLSETRKRIGFKLTPEAIEKLRKINTGRKPAPGFSEKMRELNKGKPRTDSQLIAMRESNERSAKRISAGGVIYPSLSEAGRATGTPKGGLIYRIRSPKYPDWFYI